MEQILIKAQLTIPLYHRPLVGFFNVVLINTPKIARDSSGGNYRNFCYRQHTSGKYVVY
jgi:hypothetical protein